MSGKLTDHSDDDNRHKKPTTHDERGAADLERVTDYFEEKELSVDLNAVKAVSETTESTTLAGKDQKQKHLPTVKIKCEDVSFLCQELEVTKLVAERYLKEHRGDVYEAAMALCK